MNANKNKNKNTKRTAKAKLRLKLSKVDCLDIYSDPVEYDDDHGGITWDLDFFLEEARRACGDVLEIACGTGRVAIPLALAGYNVWGIDISKELISSAKEKAKSVGVKINFSIADCRNFSLRKKFKLIFITLNSMQHLLDHQSIIAFFDCVKKHLDKDGKFIIHIVNPPLSKLISYDGSHAKEGNCRDKYGNRYDLYSERTFDLSTQLRHTTLFYKQRNKTLFIKKYSARLYFPQEINSLLLCNGFKIINKYGSFERKEFEGSDRFQIIVCKLLV